MYQYGVSRGGKAVERVGYAAEYAIFIADIVLRYAPPCLFICQPIMDW